MTPEEAAAAWRQLAGKLRQERNAALVDVAARRDEIIRLHTELAAVNAQLALTRAQRGMVPAPKE